MVASASIAHATVTREKKKNRERDAKGRMWRGDEWSQRLAMTPTPPRYTTLVRYFPNSVFLYFVVRSLRSDKLGRRRYHRPIVDRSKIPSVLERVISPLICKILLANRQSETKAIWRSLQLYLILEVHTELQRTKLCRSELPANDAMRSCRFSCIVPYTMHVYNTTHRNSTIVKLVTKESQWRKIGTRGRRRKRRGVLILRITYSQAIQSGKASCVALYTSPLPDHTPPIRPHTYRYIPLQNTFTPPRSLTSHRQ
ncbi:hypothetical protein EVAR_12149_1 [Eumeta japonica]|uniref:Uncharacterized protein n=1 Tax=Eumeta variegata TaxID=151549 RepID=A0A4C1UI71_EUMVA|nr:hypothetical protein EVAR_12149_1 [Eumeta japonica]